jgi:hypothetical protein
MICKHPDMQPDHSGAHTYLAAKTALTRAEKAEPKL